jgi:hypothetical protein
MSKLYKVIMSVIIFFPYLMDLDGGTKMMYTRKIINQLEY